MQRPHHQDQPIIHWTTASFNKIPTWPIGSRKGEIRSAKTSSFQIQTFNWVFITHTNYVGSLYGSIVFFSLPCPNFKKMLSIKTRNINNIFSLKAELVSKRGEVTERAGDLIWVLKLSTEWSSHRHWAAVMMTSPTIRLWWNVHMCVQSVAR